MIPERFPAVSGIVRRIIVKRVIIHYRRIRIYTRGDGSVFSRNEIRKSLHNCLVRIIIIRLKEFLHPLEFQVFGVQFHLHMFIIP